MQFEMFVMQDEMMQCLQHGKL